jgi:hypothetical protein
MATCRWFSAAIWGLQALVLRRDLDDADKITEGRRLLRSLRCPLRSLEFFIMRTRGRCRRVGVVQLLTGDCCGRRLVGVVFGSR